MVLIGVDLGDDDLAFVVVGELFQDRCDHPAGSTPGGPEVDQDGDVRVEYIVVKL